MSDNESMIITEFLEARIAEDEAAAERGGYHNTAGTFANDNYGCLLIQPARVLAECAAKRAIIEHAKDVHDSYREDQFAGGAYAERIVGREGWVYPFDLSPVLGALAAVYADHPDYHQEWAL